MFFCAFMLPYLSALSVLSVPSALSALSEDQYTSVSAGIEAVASSPSDPQISTWLVLPFILFLFIVATAPILYRRFWHRYYPHVSVCMGGMVVLYYIFSLNNAERVVTTGIEYVQFIAILTGLYFASAGIQIKVARQSLPLTNVIFLLVGALLANLIGTTGASILLIRPFVQLNSARIKPYHIVFFIFIVSNIGGALTPIGDPPLFLGFLKGVPFIWTFIHNFFPWLFMLTTLLIVFYFVDKRHFPAHLKLETPSGPMLRIKGADHFSWLLIVVASVFLDPHILSWVPYIPYGGEKVSFLREFIMLLCAFLAYRFANKQILKATGFNTLPMKEVAFIFIGIFGTMMPALELVGQFSSTPLGHSLLTPSTIFWSAGFLSGFLDNAPTYLTFLAASVAYHGGDMHSLGHVRHYAEQTGLFTGINDTVLYLKTVSIASVFFGAMTYIGNGPNFMVRAIAEQLGIEMPSFFGYVFRYAMLILFPLLVLVWLIFILL